MDTPQATPARPAVVAVLTRAPAAGGKSRLFAALDRAPDPALSLALLLDTLDGAHGAGWTRVVFVEPAHACDAVRATVPDGVRVRPQRSGDLGMRMRAAMEELFAMGAGAVALVGSDVPELRPSVIASAFNALGREPDALVLGPALDGGYYLVAATRTPDVFSGMAWGSASVLDDTRAAAARCGMRVELVEAIGDVDDVQDLRRIGRAATAENGVAPTAHRTRAWIRDSGVMDGLPD